MNEIEPGYHGLPFVMGRDADARSYVAHRSGGNVVMFNASGERVGHFHIGDAPDVELLDVEALPSDPDAARRAAQNTERTIIRSINSVRDHVIIDHFRRHAEPNYFLTIWTQEGALLASGISLDHPLIHVQEDRFFVLETDVSEDLGAYVIHEYQYTNV
jgi:hypothetical protein